MSEETKKLLILLVGLIIISIIITIGEVGNEVTIDKDVLEHIEYLEKENERLNVKIAEYEQISEAPFKNNRDI